MRNVFNISTTSKKMNYCDSCRENHNYYAFDPVLKHTCQHCGKNLRDVRKDSFTISCPCGEVTVIGIKEVKYRTEDYEWEIGGCPMSVERECFYGVCKFCKKENEILKITHRQKAYMSCGC